MPGLIEARQFAVAVATFSLAAACLVLLLNEVRGINFVKFTCFSRESGSQIMILNVSMIPMLA